MLGLGDRGEGDLGGAIHVVDDRTECLERPLGDIGAQLRARDEDDPQARQIGLVVQLLQRVEHSRQHHRHHDDRCHLVFFDVFQYAGRLELAAQHQRRAQQHRDGGVQETQRVEHRRRQRGHLAGLERDVRQDAADRRQGRWRLRLAPLGVPVVPLVRMMIDECLLAFGGGRRAVSVDQVGQASRRCCPTARRCPGWYRARVACPAAGRPC